MLEGVRVIDLGTVITAPLAGMMLADLGADVIKVERPEGDPFRRSQGGTYGGTFLAYNRNKRSVTLDLTSVAGRGDLLALIDGADVLLDNFRPAVLKRLGLEFDRLRQRCQRLIHCSITGFGAVGPYRDRPAFDTVAQALSGMSSRLIDPEDPLIVGPTIADNATGMYAAYAILGALVERQRTGRGRRLEVNMLEAAMAFMPDAFANYTQRGVVGDRFSRVATSQSFAFRCRDGEAIAIHLSTREKFWTALKEVIGAVELAADPRFANHLLRMKNYAALRMALAQRFLARTRAEWMARFEAVDVPFAPVLKLDEVFADPQVATLKTVCEMQHPTEGRVVGIHCPVLVDGARPTAAMRPPPTIGEHNAEVLEEIRRRK